MFRGKRIFAIAIGLGCLAASPKSDFVARKKKMVDQPDQEEFYSTSDKAISPESLKKAEGLRVKTISSIQSLLDDKKIKSAQKFELQLRMGELFAERHDFIRDQEMTAYETAYDKWKANGKKGVEPKITFAKSKAQLTRAANAFRKLVTDYPKHPRTAAALYALGKTLARLDNENSILYFNQLIRDHKGSPLVTDAYLSMGEYYFDKHRINEAIEAYKKVLANKTHRSYSYAVYKLGWAYYNATPKNEDDARDHLEKSIASFKLVVRLSEKEAVQAGRINLRDEAIKDLIMVWAETEDTATAWNYFKTIGEENSFYNLLETLGGVYSEQGRNGEAIDVYTRLLKEAPARPNNPEIYAKLVALHDLLSNSDAVLTGLTEMQRLYVKGSVWTTKNSQDKALLAEAVEKVEKNLHRYGALYHSRGFKVKNKKFMSVASEIYQLYLVSFPENTNAYEIRFYLAEIQLEFERYEQAADNYTIVALAKPKDGKYLKPAALNAVIAMNKLDDDQKYAKLPPLGQVPQPMPLPAVKKKLIAALDNYVTLLPNETNGQPMRFTAAEAFFRYGHYDLAIERFSKIAEELPGTTQGVASVKMIVGYYVEKQDWENTVKLATKYQSNGKLKDKALKTYLVGVLKNAMYNQALALVKREESKLAAEAFLAFQKAFPQDDNADRALVNAAGNYFKAGMLENALEADHKLITQYPNSELKKEVLVDVAQTYEALAQYEKAADYYKLFTFAYPKDERASTALNNAAALYKGLKKYKDSEELFARYIQYYPKNKLLNEVKLDLAKIREKMGKFKGAVDGYRDYANSMAAVNIEESLVGQARAAEITLKNLNKDQGRKDIENLRRTLVRDKKNAALEARRIVAEVLFNDIEGSFNSFSSLTVNDPAKIEEQVGKKQSRLVAVAKMYEGVIDVGSAEFTVASLYRLGQMHEDFAKTLFNSPNPKGANQAEIDKFKSAIEKVAFPLKEEAYKFYETAFKRSQEVETFTTWTQRTYKKMTELAPGKHPDVTEQSAKPEYMAHKLQLEEAISGMAD